MMPAQFSLRPAQFSINSSRRVDDVGIVHILSQSTRLTLTISP
uniref:Uncharacterized protein n=1 Tax=Arundo donax TaxID=35708 RepID=A0A0A9ABL1_ARUDO